MRDEDIVIDEDCPETTPEMWANGVWRRGGVPFKPGKTLVSLRIDTEVLEWFRSQGAGYQSHMNALLRAFYDARRMEAAAAAAKRQSSASIPRRTRTKAATKTEPPPSAEAPACGTIRKRPKPQR